MSTTHPAASRDAADRPVSNTPNAADVGAFNARRDEWGDDLTLDALQLIAESITALAGFGVAAISVARDTENLQVMAVAGDEDARATILGTLTPIAQLMSELADAEDWGFFRFVPAESLDPEEATWGWVPDMTPLDVDNAWDPMDLLVAPLFDENGQLRGIVSIDLPVDGLRPNQARREILNRYAAQAGRALEVAVQRESLREQVRMANAAREVVRNASRELQISALVKTVQPAVVTGFRALGMWIHTFDEDGHGQSAVYAADASTVQMPPELIRIAERAATDSWQAQQVGIMSRARIVGSQVSFDEVDQILEYLEEIGAGSILFVPMGAGQECVGSLVLTRGIDDPDWTTTETEAALDVGRDLGRAILNARTFMREREVIRGLQEIDRYKSQLIATLSHELKSPLTAILANVELAGQATTLEPEVRDRLAAVERGAVRLGHVVENLLTLAQVGDPDMPLLVQPVDLMPLVQDLVALTAAEADRRGVQVRVEGCDGTALALGDRAELDLVLTNLLSNAMKYTPSGGQITLTLTCSGDDVAFTCRDEGIGISLEDQARLFEEFFRVSSPEVKAESGTGLGLAIVHRIVDRHNGRIEVESELGAGSTFRVLLPAG